MNIMTLIERHPLLRADLYAYGLPNAKIATLAAAISAQLGCQQSNLCQIFAALSTREFVQAVDTRALADGANLPPCLTQSIVLTLAPWIGRYEIDGN